MNYEQKYKDALERARKIHNQTEFDYEKGMMEDIFPELNESYGEKIRKAIRPFGTADGRTSLRMRGMAR